MNESPFKGFIKLVSEKIKLALVNSNEFSFKVLEVAGLKVSRISVLIKKEASIIQKLGFNSEGLQLLNMIIPVPVYVMTSHLRIGHALNLFCREEFDDKEHEKL